MRALADARAGDPRAPGPRRARRADRRPAGRPRLRPAAACRRRARHGRHRLRVAQRDARADDINLELAGENVVVAVFGMGETAAEQAARLVDGARARGRALGIVPVRERRTLRPPPPWGPLEMTPARGVPRPSGGGADRRGRRADRGRVARRIPARHPERAAGRAADRRDPRATSRRRCGMAARCAAPATAACARPAWRWRP